MKVLNTVSRNTVFSLKYTTYDLGGERYLKTGETISDGVLSELRNRTLFFSGPSAIPVLSPGILEKEILLRTRFELDQYINLRPVKLYPKAWIRPLKNKGPQDIDFVVVRENTEGLYTGSRRVLKKGTPDEVAIQEIVNTRKGVERCIRFAFELHEKRNKAKKLTLCGKTNVLTFAFRPLGTRLHRGGEGVSRRSSPTTRTSMRRPCGW